MKKENEKQYMHMRISAQDAVQLKREILSTEVNLIRIIQRIQKFRLLRIGEMLIKEELDKKAKELKHDIHNLQKDLPKVKKPKEKKEMHEEKRTLRREIDTETDGLEIQLKEIQEKLKNLNF